MSTISEVYADVVNNYGEDPLLDTHYGVKVYVSKDKAAKLCDIIDELQFNGVAVSSAMYEFIKGIKKRHGIVDPPDNTSLSPREIAKLILKECEHGKSYYPSELADKHGLDYEKTLKAIDILRDKGSVVEMPLGHSKVYIEHE